MSSNSFESIPEDREESFSCGSCGDGDIVKNKAGEWQCGSCEEIFSQNKQNIPEYGNAGD